MISGLPASSALSMAIRSAAAETRTDSVARITGRRRSPVAGWTVGPLDATLVPDAA